MSDTIWEFIARNITAKYLFKSCLRRSGNANITKAKDTCDELAENCIRKNPIQQRLNNSTR